MSSALDMITSSMRLIGALAEGETPTAAESSDALEVFNDLLDSWAVENLALYKNEIDQYSLVAGQQEYSIGPGGNFDAIRPVSVEQAYVRVNGLDYPLRLLNTEQWNSITLKDYAAPIPTSLYYAAMYPMGEVYIWPKPSAAIPLFLSVNMQFSKLASVSETISFPPGYKKAFRYALAVELAPEFGINPPASVVAIARSSLGNIKAANRQQLTASFDPALTGAGGGGLAGFLGGF